VKPTKSGTVQFIEPMYALAVQNIPEGKEWLYELKSRKLPARGCSLISQSGSVIDRFRGCLRSMSAHVAIANESILITDYV